MLVLFFELLFILLFGVAFVSPERPTSYYIYKYGINGTMVTRTTPPAESGARVASHNKHGISIPFQNYEYHNFP